MHSHEFSSDLTSDDFSRKSKRLRVLEKTPDQESIRYQRTIWEGMKTRISALIKKLNSSNIRDISTELFTNNLLRGRGLLCRSILKASVVSSKSIPVLAILVGLLNSRLPDIGALLLTRILVQFKYAYERGYRLQYVPLSKFIAQLINRGVVHGYVATEVVFVLLQEKSEDNVETAVTFLLECGHWLHRVYPCALDVAFDLLEEIKNLRKRRKIQCLITGLYQIRKDRFVGFQETKLGVDFIAIYDQVTHDISYLHNLDPELEIDYFNVDLQFHENEEHYAIFVEDVLEHHNITFIPQISKEREHEEEGEYEDEFQESMICSCSYPREQDSQSNGSVNGEEEEEEDDDEIVIYD